MNLSQTSAVMTSDIQYSLTVQNCHLKLTVTYTEWMLQDTLSEVGSFLDKT